MEGHPGFIKADSIIHRLVNSSLLLNVRIDITTIQSHPNKKK
jgi:hypothetical protein